MGDKLKPQKLAFSRVLSRDLGLWVSAALCYKGIIENLAAYIHNEQDGPEYRALWDPTD